MSKQKFYGTCPKCGFKQWFETKDIMKCYFKCQRCERKTKVKNNRTGYYNMDFKPIGYYGL